tara:strand:- start:120 stop:242 length:123 start_codon:yes stop_codon:yes gene_type:complete
MDILRSGMRIIGNIIHTATIISVINTYPAIFIDLDASLVS